MADHLRTESWRTREQVAMGVRVIFVIHPHLSFEEKARVIGDLGTRTRAFSLADLVACAKNGPPLIVD